MTTNELALKDAAGPAPTEKKTVPASAEASSDKDQAFVDMVQLSHLPANEKSHILDSFEKNKEQYHSIVKDAQKSLRNKVKKEEVIETLAAQLYILGINSSREFARSIVDIHTNSSTESKALSSSFQTLSKLRPEYDSRLNFNDALSILLEDKDGAFAKFSTNDAYITRSGNSLESSNKLADLLDTKGYITKGRYGGFNNDNNYTTSELLAFIELRDALSESTRKILKEGAKIQRSVKIAPEADPMSQSPKQRLAKLLDFNNDGMLTSTNSKEYSKNVLTAAFQRLFGQGRDTQLHIATELAMYQKLESRVNSEADLLKIVSAVTGKTEESVAQSMKSPVTFSLLVQEFQHSFLIQVGETTPEIASENNPEMSKRYKTDKVREQQKQLEMIKERLKSENFSERVGAALDKAGYPNLDAKTMDELMQRTAFRVYSLNPQFYSSLGANAEVVNTTTNTTTNTTVNTTTTTTYNTTFIDTTHHIINNINIVQNSEGVEVSRTQTQTEGPTTQTVTKASSTAVTTDTQKSTEKTQSKDSKKTIRPTIVIGFNQDIFGMETERFNARLGAGISAVGGVDGIVFPITVSQSANLTVSNPNDTLQTKLKGNYVLGGRLSLSKNIGSGGVVPAYGIDINPNDVANAIEKQGIRLENLFSRLLITENGDLDFTNINADLATLEAKAGQTPVNADLLAEVSVLKKFLEDLKKSVNENAQLTPEEKRLMIRNNVSSFHHVYMDAIHADLRGFHLVGANITLVPMFNAIFLGLNVQHVSQHADKNSRLDAIEKRILSRTVDTEMAKKYLTVVGASIEVKAEHIESGMVQIASDIVQQVSADGKSVVLKTTDATNRLEYEIADHSSGEGILTRCIVIKQASVVTPKPEVSDEFANVKPIPAETREAAPRKIDNPNAFTSGERSKIYSLSRTNSAMISALDDIMHNKYALAVQKLENGGSTLKFITSKIPTDISERDVYLDNLLIATFGSRGIREKTNTTYSQYRKEHKKNEKAFKKLLPIAEADRKSFEAEYEKMDAQMVAGKDKEPVITDSLFQLIGKWEDVGYRDISGSLAISQIGGKNGKKSTLKGLVQFHGDIQVADSIATVTHPAIKEMILKSAESSGALQKNLDATNDFLSRNGLANFTLPEYREYLLTGNLPEALKGKIQSVPAKFVSARAAIEHARCFNDVYAMAFPLTVPIQPGVVPEVPRTPVVDVVGTYVRTGDTYTSKHGTNSGTFGIDMSRNVQDVVMEKVVNNVREVTINKTFDNTVPTTHTETTTTTTITKLPPIITPPPGGPTPPGPVITNPGLGGNGSGNTNTGGNGE